jgi:prohibitin 2
VGHKRGERAITSVHVRWSEKSTWCAAALILSGFLLLSPIRTWGQERPSRGYLGVFLQNAPGPLEATGDATRGGIIVLRVMRGSPAERGGLQRGDVILKYNGQPLGQVEELQRHVSETPIGATVELEISRHDRLLQLPVRIEPAPTSLPADGGPAWPPLLFERDELLWLVLSGAGVSLLLLYLASTRPWRRWRLTRGTSMVGQARQGRISRYKATFAGLGFAAMLLLWSCLTLIEAGNRGVVFDMIRGVRDETLGEGVHFLLPILNRVTVYDMRSRVYHVYDRAALAGRNAPVSSDSLLWTPTADGLKVGLDLSVRYRLDPGRLPELHRSVGPEFEEKVVHPIVWNATRLVASEYSLLDIYGKRRNELQQQAFSRVQALFARDGLILEDLLLRDVVYTKDFEKTLVAKMVAEQKVQETAFEVQQAALAAQAQVIEAEGEARALELVNRSIQRQPLILQYLWINSLPERVKIIVVPNRSGKPTAHILPHSPESQRAPTKADGGD